MASLSTCHLGLWLGWQLLLNLVKRRNNMATSHKHPKFKGKVRGSPPGVTDMKLQLLSDSGLSSDITP